MDKRTFLTDKQHALQTLFGEASASQELFTSEVLGIADRLATVLASLKVPSLRSSSLFQALCPSFCCTDIFW